MSLQYEDSSEIASGSAKPDIGPWLSERIYANVLHDTCSEAGTSFSVASVASEDGSEV